MKTSQFMLLIAVIYVAPGMNNIWRNVLSLVFVVLGVFLGVSGQ